jgi:antitoxin Phd
METSWALQDAKNRLGELLETVLQNGAQTITRHGKPIAVVIAAETYAQLQPQEKLVDILRDCPVKDWEIDDDKCPAPNLSYQ